MIDDLFFFLEKGVRAGGPGVDDGGYAGLQGQVRWDSKRNKLAARIGGEHGNDGNFVIRRIGGEPIQRCAAVPDVVVDVDETWSHIETGDIHDLPGLAGRNVLFHCRDPAQGNSNIHLCVQPVRGVNEMASFQEQVVTRHNRVCSGRRLCVRSRLEQKEHKQCDDSKHHD